MADGIEVGDLIEFHHPSHGRRFRLPCDVPMLVMRIDDDGWAHLHANPSADIHIDIDKRWSASPSDLRHASVLIKRFDLLISDPAEPEER